MYGQRSVDLCVFGDKVGMAGVYMSGNYVVRMDMYMWEVYGRCVHGDGGVSWRW